MIFWSKGCVEKLERMKHGHVSTFPYLHASNEEKPKLLLPSHQGLHKLCFLQKLGCQKLCPHQARLSGLVKKTCCLHIAPEEQCEHSQHSLCGTICLKFTQPWPCPQNIPSRAFTLFQGRSSYAQPLSFYFNSKMLCTHIRLILGNFPTAAFSL